MLALSQREREGMPAMGEGPGQSSRRSHWAVLAFLIAFAIILVLVSYAYLFPAIEAASEAAPKEKKTLAAYSTLLLMVVLFVLGVLLVITFRVGRFFFPRSA